MRALRHQGLSLPAIVAKTGLSYDHRAPDCHRIAAAGLSGVAALEIVLGYDPDLVGDQLDLC